MGACASCPRRRPAEAARRAEALGHPLVPRPAPPRGAIEMRFGREYDEL